MSNKLIAIGRDDLPQLRDLYKRAWPRHQTSYYTIDNYRKWYERVDSVDGVGIFALNGDWSDGTYFIIDGLDVYLNTLNKNIYKLLDGLLCLGADKEYCPAEFEMRLEPVVLEYLRIRNYNWRRDKSTLVWLPKEKALKLSIEAPAGITLKKLTLKNSEEINANWPHKFPGSEDLMRRLITFNPSVGAFNDQGELVAWCLKAPIGCLGMLQVKEGHTRKSLGSTVAKYVAKKVAEAGDDVYASILVDNTVSLNMFHKLGFVGVDELGWLHSNGH